MAQDKTAKRRRILKRVVAIILVIAFLYIFAVYSNVPFISKWRTIYIETAMSTFTHKWLATAFIPKSVIDEVMEGVEISDNEQENLSNEDWKPDKSNKNPCAPWKNLKNNFVKLYPEIDMETLEAYMASNEDSIDENGYLMIDKSAVGDKDTGIKTLQGDRVIALDTRNGIVIILHKGNDFVARMAIIKNAKQVGVALSPTYGEKGATIREICEAEGAVLGINSSGFDDPEGKGTGGNAYGLLISDGKKYSEAGEASYRTIGFDKKNVLRIGEIEKESSLRDAVEFKPILVLNGERMVEGSAGWGIQPRSAIGQTESGEVLLFIADGRAPGYSIGATLQQIADVMMDYGAVQAVNLDGGSSSIMYYNGKIITKPSAGDKANGRRIPCAFVVEAGK